MYHFSWNTLFVIVYTCCFTATKKSEEKQATSHYCCLLLVVNVLVPTLPTVLLMCSSCNSNLTGILIGFLEIPHTNNGEIRTMKRDYRTLSILSTPTLRISFVWILSYQDESWNRTCGSVSLWKKRVNKQMCWVNVEIVNVLGQ